MLQHASVSVSCSIRRYTAGSLALCYMHDERVRRPLKRFSCDALSPHILFMVCVCDNTIGFHSDPVPLLVKCNVHIYC